MFKAKIHGRDYALKTDRLGAELAQRISQQMSGYWSRRESRIAELEKKVGIKLSPISRGKVSKRGKRRPVVVVGLLGDRGGYRIFPCISRAAEAIGTKTSNICSAMRNGGTVRSRSVVYLEEIEDRGFVLGGEFVPLSAIAGSGECNQPLGLRRWKFILVPADADAPATERSDQPAAVALA